MIGFFLGMMLFSIELLRANVSRESTAGPLPADSIIEIQVGLRADARWTRDDRKNWRVRAILAVSLPAAPLA
jgi:hypothetical protein